MVKVIREKNLMEIGKNPVVILPLEQWEGIKELLEEREEALRFNRGFGESRGEKIISLEKLRKKYKLNV